MKFSIKNPGLLLFSILAITIQILSCSLPGSSESVDNLDDSMLFMISANSHMLENPEAFPNALSAAKLASISAEPPAQTRSQVNEQRILANYYLRFSSNLDENNPKYAYFVAKAHAHSQMADILQRRRNRRHTVIQKVGQAIVRPFRFVAKELTKLIKEGLKLIEEVGPEIIKEMVKSYITTGQPINAKIFFNKLKQAGVFRIKQALANKLNILLPDQQTAEEPEQAPVDPELEEIETEQDVGEEEDGGYDDPNGPRPNAPESYGTVTIEVNVETVFGGFFLSDFWFPQLPSNVTCGYSSYEVYIEELVFPLVFDLDQGTLNADFSGLALDDFPPISELSVPTWNNSAKFNGVLKDGWVLPKEDLTGWEFGAKVEVTMTPEGETRCLEHFTDEVIMTWVTTDSAPTTFTSELTGEIVQGEIIEGKLVTSPGGKMEVVIDEIGDPDDYFYLYADEVLLTGSFPVPFHVPEATN